MAGLYGTDETAFPLDLPLFACSISAPPLLTDCGCVKGDRASAEALF